MDRSHSVVANTKLLPTDDTMSGGFTHENFISEDTSVPAKRQNKDTFPILKTANDCNSLIRKTVRSTEVWKEIRNTIRDLWGDGTQSRYQGVLSIFKNGKLIPLWQMLTLQCYFYMVYIKIISSYREVTLQQVVRYCWLFSAFDNFSR